MRVLLLACLLASMPEVVALFAQSSNQVRDPMLAAFLRGELFEPGEPLTETEYVAKTVDLNGDGASEVVVYVSGRDWCGSGGCRLEVLSRNGTLYRVVSNTTSVRPPIRVLTSRTNGWRDLGVGASGGGITPHTAVLPFNGKEYATNPTVPPARPLRGQADGEVLITGKEVSQRLNQ